MGSNTGDQAYPDAQKMSRRATDASKVTTAGRLNDSMNVAV
jgi:hypothetical protein